MGSDALSATHSAVEDAQPGLSTHMRPRAGCMESMVVIAGRQTACVGTCENLQVLKRSVVTGIDLGEQAAGTVTCDETNP